jgi:hypothetical protein
MNAAMIERISDRGAFPRRKIGPGDPCKWVPQSALAADYTQRKMNA